MEGMSPVSRVCRPENDKHTSQRSAKPAPPRFSVCGHPSNSDQSCFPDFPFARICYFFACPSARFGLEAIEMPWRAAGVDGLLPVGFQPMKFFQAHQDGVERTGSQTGLLAQSVAVMPMGWAEKQRLEEGKSLWRDTNAAAHSITLHR